MQVCSSAWMSGHTHIFLLKYLVSKSPKKAASAFCTSFAIQRPDPAFPFWTNPKCHHQSLCMYSVVLATGIMYQTDLWGSLNNNIWPNENGAGAGDSWPRLCGFNKELYCVLLPLEAVWIRLKIKTKLEYARFKKRQFTSPVRKISLSKYFKKMNSFWYIIGMLTPIQKQCTSFVDTTHFVWVF